MTSYQIDIGVIDEEIERMAKDQKRRKKKILVEEDAKSWGQSENQGPEADHALNFHLRARDEHVNDGSDIFTLPAEKEELDITVLSDDKNEKESVVENEDDSTVTKSSKGPGKGQNKRDEDRARYDSLSSLITKMEANREEEERLMKQLSDAQPKDDGMTSLTPLERRDIEDRILLVRARQTEEVVASVASYKPRFKSSKLGDSKKKPNDLGLHLLKFSSYRDKGATEQHVLNNTDNFQSVHELSIDPNGRTLSALVCSNTRPLGCMELGRRNRIDK